MAGRQSASDLFGSATDPLGSELDLNGLQTGPPHEISKRTPPDPIRTPTDSASDFKFNKNLFYYTDNKIKSANTIEQLNSWVTETYVQTI